jgi:hypothetical protein
VILAAIGRHYGWPRAELEALTEPDARFWHNAAAEYWQRLNKDRR